eukprot:TRINITY_DN5542_c0_g1_i1.p1 TRINITY_DN5542_c0_g1~~TRINITY_DN5542_c0_g1_i1.p1  ORF type:complete len:555 (+),score=101.97 TRINITY_DN5542_c0_g1_i1:67-1731(+)
MSKISAAYSMLFLFCGLALLSLYAISQTTTDNGNATHTLEANHIQVDQRPSKSPRTRPPIHNTQKPVTATIKALSPKHAQDLCQDIDVRTQRRKLVAYEDIVDTNTHADRGAKWMTGRVFFADVLDELFDYEAAESSIDPELESVWPSSLKYTINRDRARDLKWRPGSMPTIGVSLQPREFWVVAGRGARVDVLEDVYVASDTAHVYKAGCLPPDAQRLVRTLIPKTRVQPQPQPQPQPQDSHSHNRRFTSFNMTLEPDDEIYVLMAQGKWSQEYFHFWTETLLHWLSLPSQLRSHPGVRVLLDARPSYVLPGLEMVGIPAARIAALPTAAGPICTTATATAAHHAHHADHTPAARRMLVLPTFPICGNPSLPQMRLLRVWLGIGSLSPRRDAVAAEWLGIPTPPQLAATQPQAGDSKDNTRRLALVLDRKGTTRDVRNAAAMAEALSRHLGDGWRVELFNVAPLDDARRIWRDASLVVAHHGAGLVNMMFARGPAIVEIHDPGYMNGCYAFMAHVLGFPYRGLRGSMHSYDVSKVLSAVDVVLTHKYPLPPDA